MKTPFPYRTFLSVCLAMALLLSFQEAASFFFSSSRAAPFLTFLFILPLAGLSAYLFSRPVRRLNRRIERLVRMLLKTDRGLAGRVDAGGIETGVDDLERAVEKRLDKVAEEKAFLEAVLNGMAEGIFVVDDRGRIVLINEALRTFFPIPPAVIDRMPLEVIRHGGLDEAIQKVLQGGKSLGFEMVLPGGPGKIMEVNVISIPGRAAVPGERAGKTRALCVFHDITQLKELERARKDFVANVSHELRTPLTTIKGFAETLLDGAIGEPVAPQFLQIIQRHADRLTKIVEDLLTLSRIETGASPFKMEAVPLGELFEDVMDVIEERAGQRQVTIKVTPAPADLAIQGDRPYLEMVLINLLDNAVKYNREGGKVILTAARKGPSDVEISVEDTGTGIPPQDLPRIFERFYRVDKGRSKEMGGTGLGLSIVKHIVQAHGGRVWAESTPGKGSVFRFILAGAKPSEPKTTEP